MARLGFAKQQHGSSLLSALVALGLLGVAGKVMMSLFSTSSKSMKAVNIRSDLQDINRTIDSRINCRNTLAPFGLTTPVNCAGPVTLLDSNMKPIVSNDAKMAGWTINARCENIAGKNGVSIY